MLDQGAPIDIFGVGTKLAVGYPDAALDGVYKLAGVNGEPRIKLSENLSKMTLPDKKQVYRLYDKQNGFLGADVVTLEAEKKEDLAIMYHPVEVNKCMSIKDYEKEALLHPFIEKGKRCIPRMNINEIKEYGQQRLAQLPQEYKRFNNPHVYKVGLSKALLEARNRLRDKYQQKGNK